ncbi:MAG: calcium-binding protein, partial [Rhodobacteraceae bacterium]|nr:calcium-binding protein [Paracoccaceae bacterium]
LDGSHAKETVHYLVVEAGTWVLPNGTLLEAGTLTSNQLSSQGFESVAFDAEFDTAPVLLSQVQTDNGGDFVTTRQTGTNADGFQITMQEEEALNSGAHVTETIGWVAIEPGSGSSGGLDWLAGHATGVTDTNSTVSLTGSFAGGANVVASLASFSGGDSAWLRGNGSTTNGFDISVEEETSLNAESSHVAETVDYFVFNGTAVVSAYDYDLFV